MRPTGRQGYTMLLVLVFLVLMMGLTSIAYRQVAAMLRVESARTSQASRDAGSLTVAARALSLLQTGTPPTNPYECDITLDAIPTAKTYTVTMTSNVANQWTIHVEPTTDGESPTPMPATF